MQVKFPLYFFLSFIPYFAFAANPSLHSEALAPTKVMCVNLTAVTIVAANCNQSNGSVTLIHDGTAPFTYVWTHDASLNDSIATGLAAGLYDVTITDAAGCNADTTVTVSNLAGPTGSIVSQSNITCNGGDDGGATISISDPDATVTWSSNPQQTGLSLAGVSAGLYTATITDASGCSANLQVIISQPGPIQLSGSVTPDTCNAGTGSATVNVLSGAQAPFTFEWDADADDPTAQTATGLSPGNHQVIVTDANGCTRTLPVVVPFTQNLFNGQVVTTDPSCFGVDDGTATITGSGGTGSYTYAWEPVGGSTSTITGLAPGDYSVTISDARGPACTATQTFTIGEPANINPDFAVIKASDCRSGDGEITAIPQGGTGPYTITWLTDPPQIGATITNMQPDIYTVEITDVNGCFHTEDVVLPSASGPELEVKIIQTDDCGLEQGIAKLEIIRGTAPYDIQWWTVPSQPDTAGLFAYNLRQGVHVVVVTGADSCVEIAGFDITGNPPLEALDLSTTPEYCELGNGTARVMFGGGTPPYEYSWTTSPVQTTIQADNLIPGPYQVTVRDQLNCTLTQQVLVDDAPGFDLTVETDDVDCYEDDNGVAVALTSGGRPPFAYDWEPGSLGNSDVVEGLAPGAYNVRVTDSEGCERNAFGVVNSADPLSALFTGEPDTLTPIVLSSAGFEFTDLSEGAEDYFWDFGDFTNSSEPSPFHVYNAPGEYYVSLFVTNNNRLCSDFYSLGPFIVVDDATLFVPDAFTPNGDGYNDQFWVKGEYVENYLLRIFDRWGVEVFQSTSLTDAWDGQLSNGGTAPSGVYMYHVSGIGPANKKIDQAGSVTVLR